MPLVGTQRTVAGWLRPRQHMAGSRQAGMQWLAGGRLSLRRLRARRGLLSATPDRLRANARTVT